MLNTGRLLLLLLLAAQLLISCSLFKTRKSFSNTGTEDFSGIKTSDYTSPKVQSLQDIATEFGITLEELLFVNPGIGSKVIAGQIIRIPVKDKAAAAAIAEKNAKDKRYIISILLPIGLPATNIKPNYPALATHSNNTLQYYTGIQLAIDSLNKINFPCQVKVLDCGSEKDSSVLKSLFAGEELQKSHLIFASLAENHALSTIRYATAQNIPLAMPLQNMYPSGASYGWEISSLYPSKATMGKQFARYLALKHPQHNILIIYSNKKEYEELAFNMQSIFYGLQGKAPKVINAANSGSDLLLASLSKKKEKENLVVVCSESEDFVASLSDKLYRRRDTKSKLALACHFKNLNGVPPGQLQTLQTLQVKPFYMDMLKGSAQRFKQRYIQRFKSEPQLLAYVGYDMMLFYGKALLQHGPAFNVAYSDQSLKLKGIHTNFDFEKLASDKGYENQCIHVLQYKNDYWTKIN